MPPLCHQQVGSRESPLVVIFGTSPDPGVVFPTKSLTLLLACQSSTAFDFHGVIVVIRPDPGRFF